MVIEITAEKIEELKAKFLNTYANLPEPEKAQIIAIVDDKPYSWDSTYREISSATNLGNKILEKMSELGLL